jgi:hypothetical protein
MAHGFIYFLLLFFPIYFLTVRHKYKWNRTSGYLSSPPNYCGCPRNHTTTHTTTHTTRHNHTHTYARTHRHTSLCHCALYTKYSTPPWTVSHTYPDTVTHHYSAPHTQQPHDDAKRRVRCSMRYGRSWCYGNLANCYTIKLTATHPLLLPFLLRGLPLLSFHVLLHHILLIFPPYIPKTRQHCHTIRVDDNCI